MYCRNCGTVVPGNEELCEACRMEQLIHKTQAPRLDMSGECRGSAILSIVMGIIGLIFAVITMVVVPLSYNYAAAGALVIIAIACTVVGIINGISGISAFKRAGQMDAIRPDASLICGIIGLVTSCISAIYVLIALAMLMLGSSL